MIEVVGVGDFAETVYTQQRLDDSSGDTTPNMIGSDQLPVGRDPRGLPPTVDVAYGQRTQIPLKIKLRTPAAVSTPLDFKLIAQPAAPTLAHPEGEQGEAVVSPSDRWNRESPVAYTRQRIQVALPPVRLRVEGANGTLTSGPRDSVLHTYPNNVTRFRLGVVNNTAEPRNITMRVLPAPSIAEWNALLRSPSDLAAWSASTRELSDAAGNSLAWTIAAAVGTDTSFPSEGEADDNGEEKGGTEGVDAQPDEEQENAPEIPPGPPLERDLVVELRDAEAPNDALYHRIRVTSQRPRRYVTATVGYSIPKQRIDIEVARRGTSAPQSPPVSIRCEVASGLDSPPQGKLEATLQRPDHRARLFVEVPAAPQRVVKLLLHVDGYPRAFVYSVRCGEHSTNSPESRNLVAVRIVNLDESIALSDKAQLVVAPKPAAPVEVQIDAPVGSFENQQDTVTLGVDGDGDDVLESDTVITLRNDRDAQVRIAEAGAGGEISFDTRVTDWRLQMPTRGLRNVVASIRGQMQVGSQSHDISPNLVGFDDAPPVIEYVGLRPRVRNIVAGMDIGIAVSARDKLSRVESVAMAFAPPGADNLPEDAELIEAKPIDENRIQWVATANVGEEAGSRTLLVQATDSAGQQGLAKLDLKVLSQEQYEATLRVTITGVVAYRSERVPETNIEFIPEQGEPLKATSDASGTFVIRNAPMGAYLLKARGILRNIPRFAEQTVTVDATKQTKMQLDLELQ
jgi:hypothetical protein